MDERTEEEIGRALRMWGIDDFSISERDIQGSPRRSLERHLIDSGDRFVLERIAWRKMERKRKEAETMERFKRAGLPVLRYIKNSEGSYFTTVDHHLWMLREYIEGVPLPRPDFIKQGWRGEALADFLIRMRRESKGYEGEAFSLKRFIEGRKRILERRYPEIHTELKGVYSYIRDFLEAYENIPLGFNHGDFHPMNVIWSENGMRAVIDWEFMGIKPEMYDAANMVGCAGIEAPDALEGDFVSSFLSTLKNRGNFSEISWNYFPQLVVATRLAWLDEWIKTKDEEMIDMEIYYLEILVNNMKEILNL